MKWATTFRTIVNNIQRDLRELDAVRDGRVRKWVYMFLAFALVTTLVTIGAFSEEVAANLQKMGINIGVILKTFGGLLP